MDDSRKVVVVRSPAIAGGRNALFWLFSRRQLEMVLREINPEPVVSGDKGACASTISWQEEILPIVCLEHYYGISEDNYPTPGRHLILKAAEREGDAVSVSMIVMPVFTDLQMGSVGSGGKQITPAFLKRNHADILGAFELGAQRIAVVPDICGIASRCRSIVVQRVNP